MRLAHFGTFDVANYGDLLFPLIARTQLGNLYEHIDLVSPMGGQPYSDVPASIPWIEVIHTKRKYDAVLVGGGNILHSKTTSLPAYAAVRHRAYSTLWIGAAELAARQRVPLVINAPGVPAEIPSYLRSLLRSVGTQATYMSVRDTASRDHLARAGLGCVAIAPDTALGLNAVLTDTRWARDFLPAETLKLLDGRFFVAHVNNRYGGTPQHAAAALDTISSALDSRACLIGIGACQGDSAYAHIVAGAMATRPAVVGAPSHVSVVAELIRSSTAYVGSSMHGYITAVSYSIPAGLVVDPNLQHKFAGLSEHLGEMPILWQSWPAAARQAATRLTQAVPVPERLGPSLDAHWNRVRDALTLTPPKTSRLRGHPVASIAITSLGNAARATASQTRKAITE